MSTTLAHPQSGMTPEPKENGFTALKSKLGQFMKGDRQVLLLAILASVVACVIVLLLWSSSEGYRPLYGSQENIDSSRIVQVLDAEGINYQIDASTGQVLVPEDKIGKTRMLLAAKGVKAEMPSGMANLGDAPLGTSQFMEQAKYNYSLEGELARTIMALDQVRRARVHLAIPKRTLFIRSNPEKPSASVLLELYAGAHLQEPQILAIANLVAGSVTGMTPDHVDIVDQAGNLLSANISANQDITQAKDKQLGYTHELEHNLIQRANSMLEPILGAGNYQVQIAALVNFNQVEETQESVDPKSVLTQENLKTDQTRNDIGLGIPGALSNKPATAQKEKDKINNTSNLSKNESRQFSVGRAVRHTRFQQMQLDKLSVSVLVNDSVAGDKGWQSAQLDHISDMVKDAIGFDAKRGDSFSINNFAFLPAKKPTFDPLPWWQAEDYQGYLRYLIGGLLGLGLIFFVLRPLVNHLVRTTGEQASRNLPAATLTEAEAEALASAAELPSGQSESLTGLSQSALAQNRLPSASSPLTEKMQHLGLLATEEPGRVAEVISHWMRDKDSE